jgi:hypothetical protein
MLSAFLQTTMQFPYVRKHFPSLFPPILPFFVLGMVLLDATAFIFLYVALVALDLRPELYHGALPALVPYPRINANGNEIPGFIIVGGVAIIAYPWVVASVLWVYRSIFSRKSRTRNSV